MSLQSDWMWELLRIRACNLILDAEAAQDHEADGHYHRGKRDESTRTARRRDWSLWKQGRDSWYEHVRVSINQVLFSRSMKRIEFWRVWRPNESDLLTYMLNQAMYQVIRAKKPRQPSRWGRLHFVESLDSFGAALWTLQESICGVSWVRLKIGVKLLLPDAPGSGTDLAIAVYQSVDRDDRVSVSVLSQKYPWPALQFRNSGDYWEVSKLELDRYHSE